MDEDYRKREHQPGFCATVRHLPMEQLAIWGLLINAGYQLVTALGLLLLFATLGIGTGALGLSYSTSSSDTLVVVIFAIIGTLLPSVTLLVPLASAASAVTTSIGLYRGNRVVRLYLGAAGAVVGPTGLATLAMVSSIGMGWMGWVGWVVRLAAMVGLTMMVMTIVVSALAVAVVSREMALLREEASPS